MLLRGLELGFGGFQIGGRGGILPESPRGWLSICYIIVIDSGSLGRDVTLKRGTGPLFFPSVR